MSTRRPFIRNIDAGTLLERFLVAAVVTVVGLRLYLKLTGYPQVGGRGLHVAHLLWGGTLMLAALVIALTYLDRELDQVVAVIGGAGFGLFIDEVGKFVTSDNNYFFQPAIAIIYVVFVVLFLIYRVLERRRVLTQEESLVNALDIIKEAVIHDLDLHERERALALLAGSDPRQPMVRALLDILHHADLAPLPNPPLPVRLMRALRTRIAAVIARTWFPRALYLALVVHAAVSAAGIIGQTAQARDLRDVHPSRVIANWADVVCALVATGLAAAAAVFWRVSRPRALRWFKRSLLVSVLLTRVFSFYLQELTALTGLAIDLVLLGAVDHLLAHPDGDQPPAPEPTVARSPAIER